MANRTIYINVENEKCIAKVKDPELNLSGLVNNLLAEWFKEVGLTEKEAKEQPHDH